MELTPELLMTMFDSFPDGILVVDKDCTIIAANKTYFRFFNERPEEFIGRNFEEVRKGSNLAKVIRTGVPVIDIDHKNRGNQQRTHTYKGIGLYISVFPLFSDGEIIGAAATYRQLTQVRERMLEFERTLKLYGNEIRSKHRAQFDLSMILGNSVEIFALRKRVASAAKSDAPVLLRGESGTGKELLAQALHNASDRADAPFVTINCPSLAESLAESELFGYEEGSFSGALKGGKLGLFELAHHGTIFLDEIGDLTKNLQAKILRVLESGEFFRVGGITPIKVDVRLISATNRDLEEMIWVNQFREDLYFRLGVMVLDVPPLRERGGDVLDLARHLLEQEGGGHTLSDEVKKIFLAYDWPGNIRELKNTVLTMINFTDEKTLRPEHLPQRLRSFRGSAVKPQSGRFFAGGGRGAEAEKSGFARLRGRKLEQAEQLQALLKEHGYSVDAKKRIARQLGVCLATLYSRIREYEL